MFTNFSLNNRVFPDLTKIEIPEKFKKIGTAITPLLMLYQPFNIAAQFGVGCQNIRASYQKAREKSDFDNCAKCALAVSSVALMVIAPVSVAVVSYTCDIYGHAEKAYRLMSVSKYKEAAPELVKAAHGAIYIVSITFGGPVTLAVSLVTQAIFELYQAYQFSKKDDMTVETLVQLTLSILRGYKLHCLNKQYNHFLTTLSSPILVIREATTLLKVHAVIYEDCNFSNKKFTDLRLDEVIFRNCNMTNMQVSKGEITNTNFLNSNLQNAIFYETVIKTTAFTQCNLFKTDFFGSTLDSTRFYNCNLQESSFFNTTVLNSDIVNCDLTNTLLTTAKKAFKIAGGTENVMTKPVIARARDYDIEETLALELMGTINSEESDQVTLHYPVNASEPTLEKHIGKIRVLGELIAEHVNGVHITGENVSTSRDIIDITVLEAAEKRSLTITGSGRRVTAIDGHIYELSKSKKKSMTVYGVLAGDITEGPLATSAPVTLDRIDNQIRRVASCADASIDIAHFTGANANSENILNYIGVMKISSNDVIISHFDFHGYRDHTKITKWPTMFFPANIGYFPRYVDYDVFVDALKAKKPRFLHCTSDSCNSYIDNMSEDLIPDSPTIEKKIKELIKLGPTTHSVKASVSKDSGITKKERENLKKLYIEAVGSVVVSGSSPGQSAYFFKNQPSHYVRKFLSQIKSVAFGGNWLSLLESTKDPFLEGTLLKQTPQFEVNVHEKLGGVYNLTESQLEMIAA